MNTTFSVSPGRLDRGMTTCTWCGAPFKLVRGNHVPICSVPCRFWSKIDKSEGCWLWTGALSPNGYGELRVAGRGVNIRAHRLAYELVIGPIPDGLVLDHLCRVKSCVNPAHLEPVTQAENVHRGVAGYHNRTTCKHGHDITDPANVYTKPSGRRECYECVRIRSRQRSKVV